MSNFGGGDGIIEDVEMLCGSITSVVIKLDSLCRISLCYTLSLQSIIMFIRFCKPEPYCNLPLDRNFSPDSKSLHLLRHKNSRAV